MINVLGRNNIIYNAGAVQNARSEIRQIFIAFEPLENAAQRFVLRMLSCGEHPRNLLPRHGLIIILILLPSRYPRSTPTCLHKLIVWNRQLHQRAAMADQKKKMRVSLYWRQSSAKRRFNIIITHNTTAASSVDFSDGVAGITTTGYFSRNPWKKRF